jgi:hypothetical protein
MHCVLHFKYQVNFVSSRTLVVVKLIDPDHSEFSALFYLSRNEVFSELPGADVGIQTASDTVVSKIRFCSLDVTFCGTELITVELEGQLCLLESIKIIFCCGVTGAGFSGKIEKRRRVKSSFLTDLFVFPIEQSFFSAFIFMNFMKQCQNHKRASTVNLAG